MSYSNAFGLPFKVVVRSGRKQKIKYRQKNMCFDYTKPAGDGFKVTDPTGNTAIRNVMKQNPPIESNKKDNLYHLMNSTTLSELSWHENFYKTVLKRGGALQAERL